MKRMRRSLRNVRKNGVLTGGAGPVVHLGNRGSTTKHSGDVVPDNMAKDDIGIVEKVPNSLRGKRSGEN
jgi:hypothetical protein